MTPSLLDISFVGLILVVALARRWVPARHFSRFGALCSVGLLALASVRTLLVVSGIVIGFLYPVHLLNRRLRGDPAHEGLRRQLVWISIGTLVSFMVAFRAYHDFTIPFLSDPRFHELLSLVGFTYFLFRAINFLYVQYLVDVRCSPSELLFYAIFPPTLTSGPIQKYTDFHAQASQATLPTRADYSIAAYRITRGYFRKLVLAFMMNQTFTWLLQGETGFLRSVAIVAAFYAYLYFDFAGYSDIAIGFGLTLGIRVPENFKSPFLAPTLTGFWRNWHITLVDWFRDHIFILLGGMHANRHKAGLLALLIMVLVGFWHGLTPFFLIWGMWHGLHLLIEAWAGVKPTPKSKRHGWRYWSGVAWTNFRVAAGCILFLPTASDMLFVMRGLLP